MFKRTIFATLFAVTALAFGSAQQPNVTIKADKTSPIDGKQMYVSYCAPCHGVDGKGGGPAAPALKKAPADLTQISKRNHGDFPAFRVTHIIDGYEIEAVHGSREMPVWGDYFRDKLLLELREHNLTEYLRSIQK